MLKSNRFDGLRLAFARIGLPAWFVAIDLLWIACGKEDTAMKGAKTLHSALDQAKIEHTFLETEGAHHWRVWRRYLRDLAPLLFK